MKKFNFQDLPNTDTPIKASTLNTMQSNIEESCVAVSPTQPETNERVWIQKGKNLFNLLCMLTSSSSSTASLVEETTNSVILKGSASTYQYLTLKKDLKAGTYAFKRKWKVISGTSNGNTGAVIISKDTDNSTLLVLNQSTSEGIFTITEDTTIKIVLYLSIDNALVEETQTEFYEIQLEQGSTATEYEAYVEKKINIKNDNGIFEEFVNAEDINGSNWKELELLTNWENLGGNYFTAQYKKIGNQIFLRGLVKNTIDSGQDKEILLLPEDIRPKKTAYVVLNMNDTFLSAYINTNGYLLLANYTAGNWIDVSNANYFID